MGSALLAPPCYVRPTVTISFLRANLDARPQTCQLRFPTLIADGDAVPLSIHFFSFHGISLRHRPRGSNVSNNTVGTKHDIFGIKQ